jgi:hypothetical protein
MLPRSSDNNIGKTKGYPVSKIASIIHPWLIALLLAISAFLV